MQVRFTSTGVGEIRGVIPSGLLCVQEVEMAVRSRELLEAVPSGAPVEDSSGPGGSDAEEISVEHHHGIWTHPDCDSLVCEDRSFGEGVEGHCA
jgi:hypothetical protein